MADRAAKFYNRSPRYELRDSDDNFIRFVNTRLGRTIGSTEFLNISATGLAFVTEEQNAPQMGDRIKIEFPVPGFQRIAWWADVVRIQEYRPQIKWITLDDEELRREIKQVMVGVRFESLPQESSETIKSKLHDKMRETDREQRRIYWAYIREKALENIFRTIVFALFAGLAFLVLWYLSQPTSLDDVRRLPWDPNFKWSDAPMFQDR